MLSLLKGQATSNMNKTNSDTTTTTTAAAASSRSLFASSKNLTGISIPNNINRTGNKEEDDKKLIQKCIALDDLGEATFPKHPMGAINFWMKALILKWDLYGRFHDLVAESLHKISIHLVRMQFFESAMCVMEELLVVRQHLLGEGHSLCAQTTNVMMLIWKKLDGADEPAEDDEGMREAQEVSIISVFQAGRANSC
mmetsp:Transcript_6128/g.9315  ORF Transcript_6128/g.9315 Transcript_6128/m.9315 type:complete len:197 (+) Transcript_6128:103-693(+)|eukprot:CAMPEP_0118706002 /NCGR_PEP_ID=MMETSP0800-20121206/20264_1 /TAXON_ID=210618 ORGANISM="Striatella unipunctata, Strain CCMP2910" /NCGR_SAMPLE_ID=MMETSP0800 /ASSEMBLY_ACC=CAM_ASM_000638 /LENGTH=196 /DNA_ID=CAMNT_0006608385 /DNA_START=86 /DNA_END=676 /DNA_ORIENTATION=+